MEGCDTLLMIGTNFPYSEWLPEPGRARGVQIDLDARRIGMRYATEVNLVGDATETLRALLPLLRRQEDRSWRAEIEASVQRWWRVLDEQAHQPADPINPQLVYHELSARLPDRCVLTADTGSVTDWWARHLRVREGMDAIVSGTLASMGPGVPYALAAKLAFPDRPVIAAVGDGAMQMLGLNALIDVAHYAERFADPRLVVFILNNRDLNQVTWEQRVLSGDPKLDASQVLPDVDYAGFARLLGLHGVRVDRPEDIAGAWDDALAAGRPAVLEFVTDPEVPPLPPHIRFEQAKQLAHAIAGGDPAAPRFLRHSLRGKLAELLTR
jgi:pyruvate dehydrogenase (quinone)